jgi:hypothetical protein
MGCSITTDENMTYSRAAEDKLNDPELSCN